MLDSFKKDGVLAAVTGYRISDSLLWQSCFNSAGMRALWNERPFGQDSFLYSGEDMDKCRKGRVMGC